MSDNLITQLMIVWGHGALLMPFHNLLLLRSRTGLDLSVNALELLGRLNAFCLVGRYPDDPVIETIPPHVAQRYVIEAGKVRTWLLQELSQLLKII
ncbi:MAG: hypothetical protein HQL79_07045 [Magnetococcales bacterium]|nr:hypothetical protein [Magnetococcales bacterium]